MVSEKLSRCSKNFWALSNAGADIPCPFVFRNLDYFLVALYSWDPKSKYCFLTWHVECCLSSWAAWVICMHDEGAALAGQLLGYICPRCQEVVLLFPAQKPKTLRISKMDTWLSLCLGSRSSQQIDLLLIQEMLFKTLLLFFSLSLICLFLLTKGIIHYSKLLEKRFQIARYEIMPLAQLPAGNGMWDVSKPTKEKVLCMCEFSIHKRCQIDSLGGCGDGNFIYP